MSALPLVAGLLVLGLGPGAQRFFKPPPDPVREILAAPDRVEAIEISPVIEESTYAEAPETIAGHRVLGAGRELTPMRARRLGALLLDEDSYRIGAARDYKDCDFLPRLALRFTRGESSTDVLVCFPCAQVEFASGSGDFDPVKKELKALVGGE